MDLAGKPHTCHLEAEGVYHNDHMDHEEAAAEAHNHEEDNREDHHPVDSSQTGRRGEVEVAAVEDPAFCSHHNHDAKEVVGQQGSHGSP
jgi:hypothetical protein